jgi:hypothetical protein
MSSVLSAQAPADDVVDARLCKDVPLNSVARPAVCVEAMRAN